jgi:hypothetical protein
MCAEYVCVEQSTHTRGRNVAGARSAPSKSVQERAGKQHMVTLSRTGGRAQHLHPVQEVLFVTKEVLFLAKLELFPSANSPLQSPEHCFEVLFPEKKRLFARVSACVSVRLLPSTRHFRHPTAPAAPHDRAMLRLFQSRLRPSPAGARHDTAAVGRIGVHCVVPTFAACVTSMLFQMSNQIDPYDSIPDWRELVMIGWSVDAPLHIKRLCACATSETDLPQWY